MDELFKGFARAHAEQNGYLLAATLSPISPPENPQRLRSVLKSSNSSRIKGDIKHLIKSNSSHQRGLDHEEIKGWVEVYAAYWNAVGDIVAGEDGKVHNVTLYTEDHGCLAANVGTVNVDQSL